MPRSGRPPAPVRCGLRSMGDSGGVLTLILARMTAMRIRLLRDPQNKTKKLARHSLAPYSHQDTGWDEGLFRSCEDLDIHTRQTSSSSAVHLRLCPARPGSRRHESRDAYKAVPQRISGGLLFLLTSHTHKFRSAETRAYAFGGSRGATRVSAA
jgi:hypothetical protein